MIWSSPLSWLQKGVESQELHHYDRFAKFRFQFNSFFRISDAGSNWILIAEWDKFSLQQSCWYGLTVNFNSSVLAFLVFDLSIEESGARRPRKKPWVFCKQDLICWPQKWFTGGQPSFLLLPPPRQLKEEMHCANQKAEAINVGGAHLILLKKVGKTSANLIRHIFS